MGIRLFDENSDDYRRAANHADTKAVCASNDGTLLICQLTDVSTNVPCASYDAMNPMIRPALSE